MNALAVTRGELTMFAQNWTALFQASTSLPIKPQPITLVHHCREHSCPDTLVEMSTGELFTITLKGKSATSSRRGTCHE
jgi:hypothetical protein